LSAASFVLAALPNNPYSIDALLMKKTVHDQ
jgi:hypothetical protein